MGNFVYSRTMTVQWGHCDPAGIVFNSRFFEFFDWNTWLLFESALGCRVGARKDLGNAGMPLVDAKARFLAPARFNDVAEITSEVSEFRRSSFDVQHRLRIDGRLSAEGTETRVWVTHDPNDSLKSQKHADSGRGDRALPRALITFRRGLNGVPNIAIGTTWPGWLNFRSTAASAWMRCRTTGCCSTICARRSA